MTIEPAELIVAPGSEVTTTVTVRNLGTRVEEFRLMPRGPAAPFASITPTTLSIYPDLEQRAVVRFAPARGPQSPAGVAPFEIMARSAIHDDVIDVARGRLTVTPFEDLRAVLTPEVSRGRRPAQHQVSVTNGGNMRVNTQLAFRDQDGELTFEPRGGAAMLQPGATQHFPVRINGPRRWFGRTERLPFSAVVTPASPQPPITLNGTRCQTAVFPWWIPTAALAIVALAIALYAVWPTPGTPRVPVIPLVDEATAVQLLTNANYIPDVIKAGDDNVAAGLAIKTDPAGNTELPHGEHVKLYVSTGKCQGPCPVEVPNVEGLLLSEAQSKLEDEKFTVRVNRVPSDRPVDQVIASEPKATTLRPLGSEVVLTVSSGPPSPPPSPGAPSPPPSPNTPPVPIELPDLTARAAADAVNVLNGLGLKPTTVTVHSNAAADGQVLSTTPAAASKVDPGSEVTLTVARNTAPVDLIATAGQAAWNNGSRELTFPGGDGDTTGFVLIRDPGTLEDGTTAKVLETHPQWVDNGFITGVYTLAEPVVTGDHVRARVGLLHGASGEVTFVVKANGKIIQQVTDGADGTLKDFDADLSPAKGATSIEITVLAGASSVQDWAVWQDLRLEPQVE
ncbi:MAG TPA: PASTA domain-containing protein [Actinophytocola sp.]|nr:PASTA domain-containing protein [Actinophytocola sp.]